MQRIIDKLNSMITMETSANMTPERTYYVAGLADALQLIEETLSKELRVGKIYFVIMYNKGVPYIEKMRLYRINDKSKKIYCFTRNIDNNNTTPDLVLASENSLKTRIFESREEAERGINLLL